VSRPPKVFRRTLLRYVRFAWAVRLSVDGLSVTLLRNFRPYPQGWSFGQYFCTSSLGTAVCIKNFGKKNSRRLQVIVQVKWKGGMKNWRFSTNISLLLRKRLRYKIRVRPPTTVTWRGERMHNGRPIWSRIMIYRLAPCSMTNDLERPITQNSRSRQYLTLNMSLKYKIDS